MMLGIFGGGVRNEEAISERDRGSIGGSVRCGVETGVRVRVRVRVRAGFWAHVRAHERERNRVWGRVMESVSDRTTETARDRHGVMVTLLHPMRLFRRGWASALLPYNMWKGSRGGWRYGQRKY